MATAMKILARSADVRWDYDEEADVLYLSIGEPKSAVGVDIGAGVVVRYDEVHDEVVGITLIDFRARLLDELARDG